MQGYTDSSYGESIAEVYDQWYHSISDVGATVSMLSELAQRQQPHAVLELGVGTGRLAIPLAESLRSTNQHVCGIDSSAAMLDVLATKDPERTVTATVGDMVDDLPPGPFAVAFVAYNTIFALATEARLSDCFHQISRRLSPDGVFVVEAFVPDPQRQPLSQVSVREIVADRVVLSVSVSDPDLQTAEGQFIDITETGGVRLRPWSIRWATTSQLDQIAATAGLTLRDRWADFDRSPFDDDSSRHVSVYGR